MDIAKICMPENGIIYKFVFWLPTNNNDILDCKSNKEWLATCAPVSATCCDNISVTTVASTTDCCFSVYIKNNSNCIPDGNLQFNIYDVTNPDLYQSRSLAKSFKYSAGIEDEFFYQYGKRFDFCTTGHGIHNFIIDLLNKDQDSNIVSICRKNLIEILCPIETCCDKISVIPNQVTDEQNDGCLWNFNISSTDGNCEPQTVTISTDGTDIATFHSPDILGTNTCEINLPKGTYHLKFDFTFPGGSTCTKFLTVSCDYDCCQELSASITTDAVVYDDGSTCCYSLHFNIGNDLACGSVKKVQVLDLSGNLLYETYEPSLPAGEYHKSVCVSRSMFNNQSTMQLKIVFIDDQNYEMCELPATINACNDVASDCNPEDGSWTTFPNTETIEFYCSDGHLCHVEFNFAYRYVLIMGVWHRDVEIRDYSYNSDCDCESERIYQMITKMWEETSVLNEFQIDPLNWNIGLPSHCFTNFRVMSADCWNYVNIQLGNQTYKIFLKKCNSDVCCWATYTVCYIKTLTGNIEMAPNQPPQLTDNFVMQMSCPPSCDSKNCADFQIYSIPPLVETPINSSQVEVDSLLRVGYQICHVDLIDNEGPDKFTIKLECNKNGKLSFIISDLLGRIVYKNEAIKNSFALIAPINVNLTSGVYILRINLDDIMLYNGKINVVR